MTHKSDSHLRKAGDCHLGWHRMRRTHMKGLLRCRSATPLNDMRTSQCTVLHPTWSQVLSKLLLHHRFIIRPVADVHLRHRVAFEDNQVRADAVEERAV
jgi:hypothetical protein